MEVMYGSPYRYFSFSMVNDNSRKFKQNQMMFCIQPCIVVFSIRIGVGEDRLREMCSLPATFYVLTRVKNVIFITRNLTPSYCRTFKQNQIFFCMHS